MKTALSKLTLAIAALLSLNGCYAATFYRDPTVHKGEEHEQWTNFYVFGLVGSEDLDVHQFCPQGDPALVKTGGNFATGLLSVVTIGIYTPRKVYVTCAASGASAESRRLELSLNADGKPVRAETVIRGRRQQLALVSSGPALWHISSGEL
ncbi:MAG TPA: hypothetical protein VGL19_21850 [Polyangiaceae bacterium]|jgi:hypothetical protein